MRTQIISLDKITTRDKQSKSPNGYIVSLWKDWETILPKQPKQVYLNVCEPGQVKGPHLHKQRWQQYACLFGKGRIVVKYGKGDYEEIDVDADLAPVVVVIPAGTASAIQATGKKDFVLLNMPSPAWHPENQDDHPVEFDDYKWKS